MKKIMGFIPSAIFFLILMVMSGIGTLIQFDFDINSIIWVAFIIGFVLRFLTVAMGKYIGSDTCYNIEKGKPHVQTPKKRFVSLSQAIDYGNFEEWIDAQNLLIKTSIYKEQLQKRINKISAKIRKVTSKNRLNKKKSREKKIAKLEEIKSYLQEEITEAFIKENIDYLCFYWRRFFRKIRFKKLNAKDFETESEIANTSKKTYSINVSYESVKGIAKGFPQMLFISLLGGMITYNIAMGSINAISFLYDIAMIIWYAINGYVGLGRKNIQRLIGVYNDRSEILSKYINQAPPDRSKAFKLLEILNNTKAEEKPKEPIKTEIKSEVKP